MNKNYLEKLEYNKILEILSNYAKTYIGKKIALELTPSFDAINVANIQIQTSDALSLLYKYGNPPIGDFNNVSIHLKKLESNNILSAKEILDLAHILKISRELYLFFDETTKNIEDSFSSINSFFNNLYLNTDLEKEIFIKIIDENTIDDRASDALYNIRKSKKSLEQNIKDKLNHFVHSSTYSKYLMEPIITIRDNRFVIPVKDEYRSQISGLIHDISSSGSTVFIEPTSIFDMNNEINTLKEEFNYIKNDKSKLQNYSNEINK